MTRKPAKGTVDNKAAKPEKPAAAAKEPPARVRIDVEDCGSRIAVFPLKSDAYAALRAIDGGILYFREKEIRQFKLEDKKDSLVIGGVDSAVLSADGQKILYQAQNQFGIVGLNAGPEGWRRFPRSLAADHEDRAAAGVGSDFQ